MSPRLVSWWGHFIFAALAALAGWFWAERTLFLDAAFQSYLFIAAGAPAIMVERFGAVAVQVLPLVGVWAGASLQTVLMLYSVSIVLFQWGMFSICLHVLKEVRLAVVILAFNVLLVGDSFYWMQNELLQGISLSLLLWGYWLRRSSSFQFSISNSLSWLLSAALAVTVVYYHPLIIFPLGFVWTFFWLQPAAERPLSRRVLLGIAALFAAIFASKYLLRQPNFYDRGMTGQYVREFNFSWERLLEGRGWQDFVGHLWGNYFLLLPMITLVVGCYLWQRRWWLAALASGSVAGYALLILQRFRDDDRWYIADSHYQALGVFVLLPLVWEIEKARGKGQEAKRQFGLPSFAVCLFAWCLLLIRFAGIYQTHAAYTTRLAYVRGLLEKTKALPGRKFVIAEAQLDRPTLLMTWGLPYETLQISALESPDSTRVIAVAEDARQAAVDWPRDSMVSFLMIPKKAFVDWPGRYYRMGDAQGWQALPSGNH